jgi:hypothetical protein
LQKYPQMREKYSQYAKQGWINGQG